MSAEAAPPVDEGRVGDRSLRRVVEAHILAAIRAGRLRPGDRLREVDLARTLGVSLTPVREALFRLVHDGLVEHLPRRGFVLTELEPGEVEDIYEFRAMLEAAAARRAAARMGPEDVAALERLLVEGERAARAGDPLTQIERNADFHGAIVRAAGHKLLARAWRLLPPLQWLATPGATPEPMSDREIDSWVSRHRRLLEALRSGNGDRAERAAREHVVRVGARRVRNPSWRAADAADAAEALDARPPHAAGTSRRTRRRGAALPERARSAVPHAVPHATEARA